MVPLAQVLKQRRASLPDKEKAEKAEKAEKSEKADEKAKAGKDGKDEKTETSEKTEKAEDKKKAGVQICADTRTSDLLLFSRGR